MGGGATGVCAAGAAGRGGIATAAGGAGLGVGGGTTVGLGVTTAAGGRDAATEAGVTNFGAAVSAAGLDGTNGLDGAGDSCLTGAGAEAAGLATGRDAVWLAASVFCWMARSTSPGREIFDKSILVLISSSVRAERVAFEDAEASSALPRICRRTNTASCSSMELECVFFSVTPTSVSASRMALLLTSNSRARSLIRILLIHPLAFSVSAKLSYRPQGLNHAAFGSAHAVP